MMVSAAYSSTREFCPALHGTAPDTVQEIPGQVLHVKGRRRREWLPDRILFMGPDEPVYIIVPDTKLGLDFISAKNASVDLSRYYEDYEITAQHSWSTAIQLSGTHWRTMEPQPGLFLIGDHNSCGVEDAFITGVWAANRICAKTPDRITDVGGGLVRAEGAS